MSPPSDSFPPPPVDSIDWNNLGFKVRDVNGHISSTYTTSTNTWSTPRFSTSPHLPIHGLAPGLNYGQSCYEGLKAFRTPTGSIQIFRARQNALRMQHSASVISIPPVPEELFLGCVRACVALNAAFVPPHESGASLYVRPLLFGSGAFLALAPTTEYTFVVFCLPVGVYHGLKPTRALVLEEFDRAAPEGAGHAKVAGNYAPVLKWSEKAGKEGFGITLHLDSKTRTVVDEFSTSGFIGVLKKGDQVTIVMPESKSAIKSITALSCTELAASFGWKIEHRPVAWEEVGRFDEVLAAGTAATLVPIRSVTRKSTGEEFIYVKEGVEEGGECCRRLKETLQGVQRGIVRDQQGWCVEVKQEDGEGLKTEI
ncbi:MAG: hypothetical protein M1814_004550 [Vezdaea aestivalis]|nr:MAG: hypothetical protein M1814_004550 [Vezdaea aestivalis]